MPTYQFEDTKTGKTFEEFMSMDEREQYLKDNPHIRQLINKINIVSGVMGQGSLKTDGGWNDNLQRIAEAHPTSPLADRYKKKSIKEVKTQQVLNKHRNKRGK